MRTLIKNARIVNEGEIFNGFVLIENEIISKVGTETSELPSADHVIDAQNKFLIPGLIDDQVHFREPGLTHKGDIQSESTAAVAGGITTFMEMPNTVPQAVTIEELEKKYDIAAKTSLGNYSFYLGVTNSNINEIRSIDPSRICGIKIFMGSSTGDMVVDNDNSLDNVFRDSPVLIATHCEDDDTIKENQQKYVEKFGDDIPYEHHADIRSHEACYKSSSKAVRLAKENGSQLHIMHLSTKKELELIEQGKLLDKRITAEACTHHLWFNRDDYKTKGAFIKWNPAVKDEEDRQALIDALNNDVLDIIATDHAPHTLEEKTGVYTKTPSGGPLVQHSLTALMEFHLDGVLDITKTVEKACHNPAKLFSIKSRGFIREGYFADLVLINPDKPWTVDKSNILYKCGWSPFEGTTFRTQVEKTFVNGHMAYNNGTIDDSKQGQRLEFDR
ncbi:dihydroorotase [bacterium SCSIO 12643]|nr:dihydroorotase [bacterium SCSIO 12643]